MINQSRFIGAIVCFLLCAISEPILSAAKTVWFDGKTPVTYKISNNADPVVSTAAHMFSSDMEAVTGFKAKESGAEAIIVVTQLDKAPKSDVRKLQSIGVPVDSLRSLTDGFNIIVNGEKIYITGTNGRGTAYGLLELSRLAGVSPWIWWGDVVPEKQSTLSIDSNYSTTQGASVEYRGIFINDEDWSLRPWSTKTFRPNDEGEISADTYRKIFELLLRLRANAIWPAMHPGSKAFFLTDGAKEVADSCGIAIGSSHCEPLLRNNVGEWDEAVRGRFNYRTNREAVHDYWIERLKQVKGSAGGNLLTIGMRGIHDSSMEGYKTDAEKLSGLQEVIDNQQELIGRYIGDPAKQTQVFVPYKEVLQLYESGLNVPDYVTLMWCDDNYGYITRLSDETEQQRSGGAGIYYHLSYWGRPHDYLWLCTTQPGLIFNEMHGAYDHNVRKIWIANVHDPKIAGYNLELFLDMAWNIDCATDSTLSNHYKNWLAREFGAENAKRLFPAMHEFYRLTGQRRPEFMGWSQVELDKKLYNGGCSPVSQTDFNANVFGNELDRYLDNFAAVADTVSRVAADLRPELADAYFASILYPVLSAEAHARKILESQRARNSASGSTSESRIAQTNIATAKSQAAYQQIRRLTEQYNALSGGKWAHSMNMRPRDLPVFGAPNTPVQLTDSEVTYWLGKAPEKSAHPLDAGKTIAMNASDFSAATNGVYTIEMLGHSMNALSIPKNGEVTYTFNSENDGDATLLFAMIPTQPNDNGDLRFSVSVDNNPAETFSLKEPFRSEQWKRNVLRGQALKELRTRLTPGKHTLTIRALDNHIVLDQLMIIPGTMPRFYLIPANQAPVK